MPKRDILTKIFLVIIAILIGHLGFILYDGLRNPELTNGLVVILGSKVNQDGTLSNRFKARLDKGLELYQCKKVSLFFVSGGLGIEGHMEGSKMSHYLISKGVDPKLIIVDDNGNSTNQTVMNFSKAFPHAHQQPIIIVSQYFHITRTKLLFRLHGFTNISGASPYFFEWRDIYSLFRELVSFYWWMFMFYFGKI